MKRNNALPVYYFCLDFFKAFRDELPDNCKFMMAEYRDKIVAATLYLHDDNDVFSFLGGADAEVQHVRPTNLLIWETIRWANLAGKRRFILGGGYRPNDGILRFKSTFSRFQEPFYVYRKVHMKEEYNLLDRRCREHNALGGEPIGYFPSYRCVENA
jgi:lipid II:glycine glycyltransferase (peptidoglycan interpeptide bridge formation enzyme)